MPRVCSQRWPGLERPDQSLLVFPEGTFSKRARGAYTIWERHCVVSGGQSPGMWEHSKRTCCLTECLLPSELAEGLLLECWCLVMGFQVLWGWSVEKEVTSLPGIPLPASSP